MDGILFPFVDAGRRRSPKSWMLGPAVNSFFFSYDSYYIFISIGKFNLTRDSDGRRLYLQIKKKTWPRGLQLLSYLEEGIQFIIYIMEK